MRSLFSTRMRYKSGHRSSCVPLVTTLNSEFGQSLATPLTQSMNSGFVSGSPPSIEIRSKSNVCDQDRYTSLCVDQSSWPLKAKLLNLLQLLQFRLQTLVI